MKTYLTQLILFIQIILLSNCEGSANLDYQFNTLNIHQDTIPNQYKNGLKHGLWKEYDENGQLSTKGFYQNGKANGLMKWYFEGKLVALGNMKDDKRDGVWRICDVHNTSNCIEARFEKDQKVGTWKVLHDNGKLWKEQFWIAGKLSSETCWDENGNPIKCK